MKALIRFIALGAALFAVLTWTPLRHSSSFRHSRAGGDPSAFLPADAPSDDDLLLTAALNHGLSEDDVVVQRRLRENARLLGLAETASDDAYGHAVGMRLGAGDPIVERRLVQQMRLQLERDARDIEPTEAELRRYLADHAELFAIPERVRVHHIFFSFARRGDRAQHDAHEAGIAHRPGLGDPSLWPTDLPLQSVADLEKVFGAATAAVVAAPLHAWTGPHRSALGYHLTKVVERIPATVPPFEAVRAAVRLAWLNERAEHYVQQYLTALR